MDLGGEGDPGDRASDCKQLLITLLLWYMLWSKEAIPMANTLPVYARIGAELEEDAEDSLRREELDAKLWEGVRSLEAGRFRSADEVDAMFERKYGG